jgi:predicted ester cyclase
MSSIMIPLPIRDRGRMGISVFFLGLRAAFPDLTVTVDRLVQNETDIAIAYMFHGTHHEFFGIAPIGRHITARGMQIARFENGKIVERWGSSDELGILLKLGAKVSPG